ncbi:transporter substrate-binding domain-containing protein [Streptomyces sp. NRRL WC-3549]|uniref:nSTAND1 domain-containing NTPase n=1 Tax=Streptomyces sp. NRRL WC-3549 TaxID=1463925 RepID=UPI000AD91722|nr:transporter substrate-binding domain-containing protein [Streptomyces sp. NRRL WC-3549]
MLCPNPAYRPPALLPVPERVREGPVPQTCPYPGLAAFAPSQAQWFFGREHVITELAGGLAGCMDTTDPLVLMGPSGAGKSSVLAAGLLSALGKGAMPMPGARTWPHLLMTPTEHPLAELATRLERLAGVPGASLREEIESDPRRLAPVIREMLRARAGRTAITGSRLVLVVDQFEEVFTQCADGRERQLFISALCAAAGGGGDEPPALVVLGLRSDFQDHCATYPELRHAVRDTPVFLGPMTAAELREAIAGPARIAGLELQPGLVEILLRDLGVDETAQGYDPESLPLLSHALHATWHHREGRSLTVAGYAAAGYVRNSVENTAEATYGHFDSAEQQAARSLLLNLVHIGEGTQDTRRRANRIRLLHDSTHPETTDEVLDRLVDAQLVTVEAGSVFITHEVLLHAWPRLRQWIHDDRSGLRIHQQLAQDADAWDQDGRNPARLYRGSRLGLAREWAANPTGHSRPTPLQRTFLHAGAQAIRRRNKMLGLPAVALSAALLVMAGWLMSGGATDEPDPWKVSHPLLRVGVAADQPGMSVYDEETNSWSGFEIQMAREIARNMGYDDSEVAFSSVATDSRVGALGTGHVDFVIASFGITDDRRADRKAGSLSFAGPYYMASGGFLVRGNANENAISDSGDLLDTGAKVCTARGSPYETALPKLGFTMARAQPDTYEGCLNMLLDPRSDVYAMVSDDIVVAGYEKAGRGKVRRLDDLQGAEGYGVAMRSETPALKREVCSALKEITAGGAWEAMYRENLAGLTGAKPIPSPPDLTECEG